MDRIWRLLTKVVPSPPSSLLLSSRLTLPWCKFPTSQSALNKKCKFYFHPIAVSSCNKKNCAWTMQDVIDLLTVDAWRPLVVEGSLSWDNSCWTCRDVVISREATSSTTWEERVASTVECWSLVANITALKHKSSLYLYVVTLVFTSLAFLEDIWISA